MPRFPHLISGLPFPVQGLLVCAALLVVGIAVVDDYSATLDGAALRHIAEINFDFITGKTDALAHGQLRFYGVAFELPLFLLERSLGLEDARHIYLLRHLLTHLFFLAGGFCGSLLVYRLFHSRELALLALLVFVLQPRLYAHSFFNSKDLPFLSMFMVSLYLTHRAFRTQTVGAFLVCGVSVGVLTNLRIMGGMVFPAVLALRGLDLLCGSSAQRKHVRTTGAVFTGACLGTLYGLTPYLWADPFELLTAVRTLAHQPVVIRELFQGELIRTDRLPPHFIPTWLAISTPSITLGLGVLGATLVGGRSVLRAREALRNTDLRFGLLLLACLTLPVVAVGVLGSHLQDSWRHMFFLHAPLCVLGMWGLQWAGGGSPRVVAGVSTLVGIGLLVTVVEMVRLHPHQQVYFNVLVDRTAPGYLSTHYVMDPWHHTCREGLEFLRRRYPDTIVYISDDWSLRRNLLTLPTADRSRIVLVRKGADFDISCGKTLQRRTLRKRRRRPHAFDDALYVHEVYNSPLVRVTAKVMVPERERSLPVWTETYRGATSGKRLVRSDFDIYADTARRALGYAKEGCTALDRAARFFVHVYPVDVHDLPKTRRHHGFDTRNFDLLKKGAWTEGKCWTKVELPTYPISWINTGQFYRTGPDQYVNLWESGRVQPFNDILQHVVKSRQSERSFAARIGTYRKVTSGKLLTRAVFDIYADPDRRTLNYAKDGCTPLDRKHPFFVHLYPLDVRDLPEVRRQYGFDTRDFDFPMRGGWTDEQCWAKVELPDYPIYLIHTGQYNEQGKLWEAEFVPPME